MRSSSGICLFSENRVLCSSNYIVPGSQRLALLHWKNASYFAPEASIQVIHSQGRIRHRNSTSINPFPWHLMFFFFFQMFCAQKSSKAYVMCSLWTMRWLAIWIRAIFLSISWRLAPGRFSELPGGRLSSLWITLYKWSKGSDRTYSLRVTPKNGEKRPVSKNHCAAQELIQLLTPSNYDQNQFRDQLSSNRIHHLTCTWSIIRFSGRVQNFHVFRLICIGKSMKIEQKSDLELWEYSSQQPSLWKIRNHSIWLMYFTGIRNTH